MAIGDVTTGCTVLVYVVIITLSFIVTVRYRTLVCLAGSSTRRKWPVVTAEVEPWRTFRRRTGETSISREPRNLTSTGSAFCCGRCLARGNLLTEVFHVHYVAAIIVTELLVFNLMYINTCLWAYFSGWPGKLAPTKLNHSGFYWSKRWWGGTGISLTICKSFASRFIQMTMPAPHHLTLSHLTPNQECRLKKNYDTDRIYPFL